MADEAVGFFLENLRILILGHEDIIFEVKNELKKLMDGVRFVKAVADRMLQAEQLREMDLERQMKEVLYDVEDAVESSSVQMAAANARNRLFRRHLMKERGEALVRTLESIRSRRLEPITRRIQAFKNLGIKEAHSTETNQVPSKQQNKEDPAVAPKKLVGLKDEAETLIISLMEETGELDFIAITGMPGIGKTTLASQIYRDKRIQHEFPTRIWVWVDGDFRRNELCLNILKQGMLGCPEFDIAQGSCSSIEILNDFSQLSDDQLKDAIRACLGRRKYLLVMDGLWDADSLNEVTDMLPKMGGKVLITSRNNQIATKPPHVLRFLNEKQSWELLQLEVFGELDECPETLKETGECIARNCDGLPLAIAVVGSSLVVASSNKDAQDLTIEWWKEVSLNVTLYVTDYGDHHNAIKRVELSYTRLPQHLQQCFLYLGVFPEGHEIHVRTLARLWIAEGLVHDNKLLEQILGETEEIEMQNSEEIAAQHLHYLIDRNLVMVVTSYPNGHIKTCRLHKLIYAFCKYKAAELDLYQEIKMSGDRPLSLAPDCHRLCIYSSLSKFLSSTPKGQRVRSVLYLNNKDTVLLDSNHSSIILECFKLLRVLECSKANFTGLPKKLGKLIHLRYISLSCDEISVIPETISLLRYLETLVVHTRSSSLQVKANLWKMVQLRHFVTKAAIVLAIRGNVEAGKNLQTLTRLAPACCTEDVFLRAPNLKTLGIRGNLANLPDANSLRKLELLEHLKLINETAADSLLPCLVDQNCFPSMLKRLTLSGTYLGWENMSILGKIDGLEILKLKNNAFIGESWSSTYADGFCRLGFLLIATTDLESWEASPDCFPSLECLVLKNCEKLHIVPSSLVKSLVSLDVENVSESADESAQEIQQQIARKQGQKKR